MMSFPIRWELSRLKPPMSPIIRTTPHVIKADDRTSKTNSDRNVTTNAVSTMSGAVLTKGERAWHIHLSGAVSTEKENRTSRSFTHRGFDDSVHDSCAVWTWNIQLDWISKVQITGTYHIQDDRHEANDGEQTKRHVGERYFWDDNVCTHDK